MKNLIAIFSFIIISNSFAGCFQDFSGEEYGIYNSEQHDIMYTDDVLLTEEDFNNSLGTLDFDYTSCREAIKETVLMSISGVEYTFLLTSDDQCDGGNTYGMIYDESGVLVGTVQDGDIYCTE